jgi:hypothetical protein
VTVIYFYECVCSVACAFEKGLEELGVIATEGGAVNETIDASVI